MNKLSESKQRGCPVCEGADARSCLLCRGETRMCDWYNTGTGWAHYAVRDMEASIDAVQPEASTTLEQAESHAHICGKMAEQYKSDPVLSAALTDAAAIIRDLLRDRLGASATGAGQAEIEALRETLATLKAENERLRAEVERWAQSAHEGWRYAKECDDGRVEDKRRTVTYVCPVCAASLERQE